MSLNTAVLGQLGARICLKLSTSECSRFLAPGNESPARFQHPGQALLNEREGAVGGNAEFRAANYNLSDLRKLVEELSVLAPSRRTVLGPPFIYDADTPVSVPHRGEAQARWDWSRRLGRIGGAPVPVVSALGEKSTLAIVGGGVKTDLLLAALRDGATSSGLAAQELTTNELAAAGCVGSVRITGPVVVRMTESGFAAENALQELQRTIAIPAGRREPGRAS